MVKNSMCYQDTLSSFHVSPVTTPTEPTGPDSKGIAGWVGLRIKVQLETM